MEVETETTDSDGRADRRVWPPLGSHRFCPRSPCGRDPDVLACARAGASASHTSVSRPDHWCAVGSSTGAATGLDRPLGHDPVTRGRVAMGRCALLPPCRELDAETISELSVPV